MFALRGVRAAATAVAVVALVFAAGPAVALPADQFGVYPTWGVAGSSGVFTATPSFPASAGFPATTVTSTATSVQAPSGASNFYNAGSDFGAEFGTSRNQPYLNITTAASQAPSITNLDFAAAPPAGWGFALGDVDADWVFVQAWADDARTIPLTVDQLGFQSAGNSCVGSPRPSACSTPGLLFESPVWVTAPATFDGVSYVPGTLRGSTLRSATVTTLDSAGAYGWFRPAVPVRSIQLMFGARDGFPTYSLTLAAPAPKATIIGTITGPEGAPVPPGTEIALQNEDGTAVLDLVGEPVTTPVEPDGTYTIESEQRETYLLDPVVPPGYIDPPAFAVAADEAEVTAPPVVVAPVVVTPSPSAPPVDGPPPGEPAGEAPEDELAASGSAAPGLLAPAALGLVLAGAVIAGFGASRRRSAARA